MSEYIDPADLPEGWTLCELEDEEGIRIFREVSREGRYRAWSDQRPGALLGVWRIVRVIDRGFPDSRVEAWLKVVHHPAIDPWVLERRTLGESVMARLDDLLATEASATPDLPVVRYEDIPRGAIYEVCSRYLRGHGAVGEAEYRLVGLPDPEGDLRRAVVDLIRDATDTTITPSRVSELIELVRGFDE